MLDSSDGNTRGGGGPASAAHEAAAEAVRALMDTEASEDVESRVSGASGAEHSPEKPAPARWLTAPRLMLGIFVILCVLTPLTIAFVSFSGLLALAIVYLQLGPDGLEALATRVFALYERITSPEAADAAREAAQRRMDRFGAFLEGSRWAWAREIPLPRFTPDEVQRALDARDPFERL